MRLEALPTGVVFSMSSSSRFRRDGVNLEGPLQQLGVQQEQRSKKKKNGIRHGKLGREEQMREREERN